MAVSEIHFDIHESISTTSMTRCRRHCTTPRSSIAWPRNLEASSSDAKNDLRQRFETEAERVHYYRTSRGYPSPIGGRAAWTPSV